ncbi:MAG TPA: metal ABC transporter ATP-binding protein [Rectinemataceae bacterium]|nr:metal ABC transporter ATP-binding protein [Rectinemataceae bacterium]
MSEPVHPCGGKGGGGVEAVSARGLSVGYSGDAILSNLSFSLRRGETLALVGANGSGKSTLLKTIAGLLHPLGGEALALGGLPLANPVRVAYLGQFHPSGFVLPLRVLDIVRMGRFAARGLFSRFEAEDETAVREAIEAVGIADIAKAPLNELSGGQRQRVFIAQTLAKRAELLLLDEPEANLDAASRAATRRLFADEVGKGASAVIATHDIEAAAACDYTMLLARRVVAYGISAEVLRTDALLDTFGVIGRAEGEKILVVNREHEHDCGDENDAHA